MKVRMYEGYGALPNDVPNATPDGRYEVRWNEQRTLIDYHFDCLEDCADFIKYHAPDDGTRVDIIDNERHNYDWIYFENELDDVDVWDLECRLARVLGLQSW